MPSDAGVGRSPATLSVRSSRTSSRVSGGSGSRSKARRQALRQRERQRQDQPARPEHVEHPLQQLAEGEGLGPDQGQGGARRLRPLQQRRERPTASSMWIGWKRVRPPPITGRTGEALAMAAKRPKKWSPGP